jgi:hypothetical protein
MAYYIGLDLGQSSDFTALAIVQDANERNGSGEVEKRLRLRHLERYPLRTPYTQIADGVAALMRSPALNSYEYDPGRYRMSVPKVRLFVDSTGVGAAVTDLLKARGLNFTAITITGGEKVHGKGTSRSVPKRDLVAALEVPFHTGELQVAEGLELWPALREELLNFRRKINLKTAHDSYEHWRESDHDDLVLACALACWGARRAGQQALRLVR